MKQVGCKLDESDYQKLKSESIRRNLPVAELIRHAILKDLAKIPDARQRTLPKSEKHTKKPEENSLNKIKTKSGLFKCPECGLSFKTEEDFYVHYNEKH